MNTNKLAEQAFKEWEKTQTFAVSSIEEHGFINGYNWAYCEQQAGIEALKKEVVHWQDAFHKGVRI